MIEKSPIKNKKKRRFSRPAGKADSPSLGKKIKKVGNDVLSTVTSSGNAVKPVHGSCESRKVVGTDRIPSAITDTEGLRVLRYCVDDVHQAERHLFVKADAANSLSLIIANIPPYISNECVKRICELQMNELVKEVVVQSSTSLKQSADDGYRKVSVRFETESCVERAFASCDASSLLRLSDASIDVLPCGTSKYCREYRAACVPAEELQQKVDTYMGEYDARVLEEKKLARKMRNVPDEDGWITVRRSHYKAVPAAVVVKNKEDLLKLSKKKRKSAAENVAFYSFQMKQSKMKHLEELRKKFEEDKKKIALAKAARKFRPA